MTAADLYLDLLARALTRALFEDNDKIAGQRTGWDTPSVKERVGNAVAPLLARGGYELVRKRPYDAHTREHGLDWPARAETMVGLRRLENIKQCVESVIADDIPGDLIETGTWRGGASIYMRGVLAAHDDATRKVWVADSFRGLPPPDPARYPADAAQDFTIHPELAVGVDQVRDAFRRYGLLDDQVEFLVGWFKDTLPGPVRSLSVLRLDGDMYESTIQALEALYPLLSPGGYCIVDDYFAVDECRKAVHDYRERHRISAEIVDIDGTGAYWRSVG